MVVIAFVASLILTVVFQLRKRQLKAKAEERFWFHFFDKSLEFLFPFTIIAGLFCLLSLFISGASDILTIRYLRWFENALGWIKSVVALFKLSAFATGIVLILFYLLSLTRIPSKHTARMLSDLRKYKTFIKTVYMIVIILFSFTFFGVQSDKPAADLQFRIKENDKLYGELRDEVEATLRKEVADKLYFKFYHSFPRDYRIDMDRGDDGPEPSDDGSPTPTPSPDGGGDGGGRDSGDSGGDVRGPIVYDVFDDSSSEQKSATPAGAPEHASARRIAGASEALRRYRTTQKKFIRLLATDMGREMALQPARGATSSIRQAVLKELIDKVQILEPIAGTVVGLVDKILEPFIQKGIDRITAGAVQDPEATRQLINIEASAIVKRKDVGPVPPFSARVQQVREAIAKRWEGFTGYLMRAAPSQTAEEVARISEQIHLLTCPSEENRLNAARALAQGGARLTQSQVQQIKESLKLDKWRFRLSTTEEGMYVEVPVKLYPALALEGMRSRHVSSADRVAAAEIIYDVETHPPDKQYTKEEVDERMVA